MLFDLFRKKKERKTESVSQNEANTYWVQIYERDRNNGTDYATVRITGDESYCDKEKFLSFSYNLICRMAENNNLCYYVEYDENLPQHKEVIRYIQNNFVSGDIYSIIYSAGGPILSVRQAKPSVEIMAKAGKDGFDYASGLLAYIYKGVPEFNQQKEHNAVELLGVEKRYIISAYVNDVLTRMLIDYDEAQVSFNEIITLAEETAREHGVYLEVLK